MSRGLLKLLRKSVELADKVTSTLQSTVTLKRYTGQTGFGKTWAAPVSLDAIVDWRQRQVRTPAGLLSVSRAMVTFLDVDALKAATAGQGIQDEDIITLPDGTTGPILDMAGFIDRETTIPVATEVFLG
jgi:hypothetical protein